MKTLFFPCLSISRQGIKARNMAVLASLIVPIFLFSFAPKALARLSYGELEAYYGSQQGQVLGTTLGIDTTFPTVAITYPANGETVSGKTYITAFAEDNIGVKQIKFYLDGTLFSSSNGGNLTMRIWNTASSSPGSHVIRAEAVDAAGNLAASALVTVNVANGSGGADTVIPSAPANLTATAASCGQVDLAWSPSKDLNGSGTMSYHIYRSQEFSNRVYNVMNIAAGRSWFDDVTIVKSATTYSYYIIAKDWAGNQSAPSNVATVTTLNCPSSIEEEVVDSVSSLSTDLARSNQGVDMAVYGNRKAVLYEKENSQMQYDTYIFIKDEDTGLTSKFLLYSGTSDSSLQAKSYVFTSPNVLWVLIRSTNGGSITLRQYQLNGSPIPVSAALLSSKTFGGVVSCAKSLTRLQDGALVVVWAEEQYCDHNSSTGALQLGIAYRNPSGAWSTQFPITPPVDNGGWKVNVAVAQHPADNSLWLFYKEDTSTWIGAVHFTETINGLNQDWINSQYIIDYKQSVLQDGDNAPDGEFPYLKATADPNRNVILLAYQRSYFRNVGGSGVHTDPLFGVENHIILIQASIVLAHIEADGSKTFNTTPAEAERISNFGLFALADGTIWLAYQPINRHTLTMNEIYATKYNGSSWSAPVLAGYSYNHSNMGNTYANITQHPGKPQIALLAPDEKIHIFKLDSMDSLVDNEPPTVPSNLTADVYPNQVDLSWQPSTDNVGVFNYLVYRNGIEVGVPAITSFIDTAITPGATYTYTVKAADSAGNVSAASNTVSVTIPQQVPVVIYGSQATAVTKNSATITWTTNIPTKGTVYYGKYNRKGTVFSLSATDNAIATSHSVVLTNLSAKTDYRYRITAQDPVNSGNIAQSPTGSFKTTR